MTIVVTSNKQIAELRDGTKVLWSAPVSTSQFGLGEDPGSFKTPRGWHHIAGMFGESAPLNAIFEARQQCGIWDGKPSEKDLILTRILWLAGEEAGNISSHERFIYFHGTNHEDKIGSPASHGCVRLKNADILELFERIHVGTKVLIE